MIGRDPITIHYTVDGEGAEQTVYGTVVTEQPAGELAPSSGGLADGAGVSSAPAPGIGLLAQGIAMTGICCPER